MERIEAIIRPHRLDDVKDRLREIGVSGMTITEVRGFGRTGGKTEVYRGSAYVVDFVPKLRLDVVVKDAMANEVVQAISAVAKSGKIVMVHDDSDWREHVSKTLAAVKALK